MGRGHLQGKASPRAKHANMAVSLTLTLRSGPWPFHGFWKPAVTPPTHSQGLASVVFTYTTLKPCSCSKAPTGSMACPIHAPLPNWEVPCNPAHPHCLPQGPTAPPTSLLLSTVPRVPQTACVLPLCLLEHHPSPQITANLDPRQGPAPALPRPRSPPGQPQCRAQAQTGLGRSHSSQLTRSP